MKDNSSIPPNVSPAIIIRLPEVRRRTGLGRATIYDFMRRGRFPSSIRLGGRSVGWIEAEIDNWVASCRRLQPSWLLLAEEMPND